MKVASRALNEDLQRLNAQALDAPFPNLARMLGYYGRQFDRVLR